MKEKEKAQSDGIRKFFFLKKKNVLLADVWAEFQNIFFTCSLELERKAKILHLDLKQKGKMSALAYTNIFWFKHVYMIKHKTSKGMSNSCFSQNTNLE